jgi:hypothetical protein
LVGLEARAASHYWACELIRLGHDVKLMPAQYGHYFGTRHFDPVVELLNERARRVHIQPAPPVLAPTQDFGLPPSLYEFTFESTRVAAQAAYDNVFGRFPNLKLILSHGGGAVSAAAKAKASVARLRE